MIFSMSGRSVSWSQDYEQIWEQRRFRGIRMKSVSIKKIILLYLVFVCLYSVIVSFFTSTVHIDVDEELYLEMARSFYYEGRFALGGEIVNYSCILYSMLISSAYFFYSPENILLLMRLIGVAAMTSAVFPIWLIAKKILNDDNAALKITVFSMLLPFMFDSAYIMQEVLAYPLFLWSLWFLLCAAEKDTYQAYFLSALFGGLCFFTKTYLFFIPIVFNIVEGVGIIKAGQAASHTKSETGIKKRLKNVMVYDVTYLAVFAVLYFVSYMINDFSKGNNHYSSQFSHLFPISINTVICGIFCCVFYMAFFIVNTGILPFAGLVWKRKNESGYEGKFWGFIYVSVIFLIFEIVVMIVLTEEGNVSAPHKYLFRYFQIFTVPLLLAFISSIKVKDILGNKKQLLLLSTACIITVLFWVIMYQRTSHGIIDGHLFVLLENLNRVMPYAGAIATAGFSLLILGVVRNNMRFWKLPAAGAVMCFWLLNCVQLPYYSNVIASGAGIKNDSIKIAEYLNTNDISDIYYVRMKNANPYLQNCYGYFKQPFTEIELNQVEDHAGLRGSTFIVPIDSDVEEMFEKLGLKRIEMKTDLLSIYAAEDSE